MGRRARTIEQQWYDVFTDWGLDDQAAAIRMLEELHRQKRRMEGKEPENGDKRSAAE